MELINTQHLKEKMDEWKGEIQENKITIWEFLKKFVKL